MRSENDNGKLLEVISSIPLYSKPLDSPINRFIKRSFDLLFSAVICFFLLSWLLPIIAIWIKLDSRGPIFFRQQRHGLNGKTFWCWKLRTMCLNQEQGTFKQTSRYDVRITKVGAWLRRTSLDELPQFFNVLLGEMSVVGPRPHPVPLNEEYSYRIETLMARHEVKPGITGLAQSNNHRGEIKDVQVMAHRIKYDRYYILNWSFWLDVKIVLKTIPMIIRGSDNAY